MNRDLEVLFEWAAEQAGTDPDIAARPLWQRIADEVEAYLNDSTPPDPQTQSLFEGTITP